MKVGIPFVKNVLALLGITAAMSAIDGYIYKKNSRFWTKTLIISNKDMDDVMKIIKTLEDSSILLKGVTETIKNETKE